MSLLKTQTFFLKKSNLSSREKVWPNFSRCIEHDNCEGTFYKGPKGLLTIIVQVESFFLEDLRGC